MQHPYRIAERIMNKNPTTRRMLEEIPISGEEHADDLASLLEGLKD